MVVSEYKAINQPSYPLHRDTFSNLTNKQRGGGNDFKAFQEQRQRGKGEKKKRKIRGERRKGRKKGMEGKIKKYENYLKSKC